MLPDNWSSTHGGKRHTGRRCARSALDGQRSAALAHYETFRRALAQELNAEPAEETTALYTDIRQGTEEWGNRRLVDPASWLASFPSPPTPLIGRKQELAEIAHLLEKPSVPAINVGGARRIGKTRLALQAATEQLAAFADGVYFVPLGLETSADLALSAIASAVGLTLSGQANLKDQLLHCLRHKDLLLALDDFEHLLHLPSTLPAHKGKPEHSFWRHSSACARRDPLDHISRAIELAGEWVLDVQGFPSLRVKRRNQSRRLWRYRIVCAERASDSLGFFSFGQREILCGSSVPISGRHAPCYRASCGWMAQPHAMNHPADRARSRVSGNLSP